MYTGSTSDYDAALYLRNVTNHTMLNNVLVAEGGSSALREQTYDTLTTMDYNVMHVTNGALVRSGFGFSTVFHTTLASWQTASLQDSNSTVFNPIFISPSDLHVLNQAMDSIGLPLADITHDIDGQQRPGIPDPGADEVFFVPDDVGAYSIEQPQSLCQGSNPVVVKIRNFGSVNLNSANVHLAINGVTVASLPWSGTLTPGQVSGNISMGSFNFPPNMGYLFEVWTTDPNGFPDAVTSNDTIATTTPLYPALSGTFSIGPSNADFATIQAAADALTQGGICGNVVFNIDSGTYTGQVTIGSYSTVHPNDSVIFQSLALDSSQVIIEAFGTQANNYVMQVAGAGNITFQHLTIRASSPFFSTAVVLSGSGANVNFREVAFWGAPGATVFFDQSLVVSTGGNNDNCRFEENTFHYGTIGLWLSGQGNVASTAQVDLLVKHNRFLSQEMGGIRVSNQNGMVVRHNTIIGGPTAATNHTAINLTGGTFYSTVKQNKVIDGRGSGIVVTDGFSTRIENNFLSLIGPPGLYFGSAVGVYDSPGTEVFHNSVWGTGNVTGCLIDEGNPWHYEVKNNVFYLTGGTMCVYITDIAGTDTIFDHNLWYTNGPQFGRYEQNSWSTPTIYDTFADWTSGTTNDSNSVEGIPTFVAFDDLHMIGTAAINDLGTPIPDIPNDIDGDSRSTIHPDVGADEFNLAATEVAATFSNLSATPCSDGTVEVSFESLGFTQLTVVDLEWTVNGISQTPSQWTGNLGTGQSTTAIVGSYNFEANTAYDIKVWLNNPNGAPDAAAGNDTAYTQFFSALVIENDTAQTLCPGDLLEPLPGPFSTYQWSNGGATASIRPGAAGTYTVTVSNAQGCIDSASFPVSLHPAPPVPTITANGDLLTSS